MKKILLLVVISSALLSCSKKSTPVPSTSSVNDAGQPITIMGTAYPVVKIGNQSWTSINYNGPGGLFNTGNPQQTVLDGKLYSSEEAAQIPLPGGWRIPTYNDYLNLLIAHGATKNSDGTYSFGLSVAHSLMTENGWSEGGGNKYSKFNALPTGFYHLGAIYGTGNGASFLHSFTPGAEPDAALTIGPGPDGQPFIYLGLVLIDGDRCSIRFVKDN
ncbi:MAG TPA: FISUMP domain-containing protein [Mucilaginibacter sp.]|nr:FISUMP domain-containing protein [Mucilaginibacter sp.]